MSIKSLFSNLKLAAGNEMGNYVMDRKNIWCHHSEQERFFVFNFIFAIFWKLTVFATPKRFGKKNEFSRKNFLESLLCIIKLVSWTWEHFWAFPNKISYLKHTCQLMQQLFWWGFANFEKAVVNFQSSPVGYISQRFSM